LFDQEFLKRIIYPIIKDDNISHIKKGSFAIQQVHHNNKYKILLNVGNDEYVTKKEGEDKFEKIKLDRDNVGIYSDFTNIKQDGENGEPMIGFDNIIEKYDFLIHFEPRQLLQNFNFIEYFLKNQENLFTYGSGANHFNTGLLCIRCCLLIDYIKNVDIHTMVNKYISIEYDIYNFFINNKIPYTIRDKMELIWFDTFANSVRLM
jgi:hypothetical protein